MPAKEAAEEPAAEEPAKEAAPAAEEPAAEVAAVKPVRWNDLLVEELSKQLIKHINIR